VAGQSKEYEGIIFFITLAAMKGRITPEESEELGQVYVDLVMNQAGFKERDNSDPAFHAVATHAARLIEAKLLRLHPELKAELDEYLGRGRECSR
jgi:hypothetical protein